MFSVPEIAPLSFWAEAGAKGADMGLWEPPGAVRSSREFVFKA